MSLDNRCTFIGRLAAVPDPLGPTGVKFRLGTDAWNGQTKTRETVWVPLVAWGKDADLMKQHGSVGRQLAIEAEYRPREYDHQGQKRLDPQFVVKSIKLLAESNKQAGQFVQQPTGWQEPNEPTPPDPGYGW